MRGWRQFKGVWLGMLIALGGANGGWSAEYPRVGDDVFDPRADGDAQVKAARADAAESGRRVVLILGANWCSWCHRLDRLLREDPELQARWARDFVLVRIDVNWKGLEPRNPRLLGRYRRPPQRGIPVLTLLDADGRVLASPDISRWETKEPKDFDVVKLREFFAAWAPAAGDAKTTTTAGR